MSKTTVNLFQTIKESIPAFIRDEFPLFAELLEEYYICLEKNTGVYDILNRINDKIKIDEILFTSEETFLSFNITNFDTIITVDSTVGFPETNGTIKIDDEIIFYKEKNETQFLNCTRGFSGSDSFGKSLNFTKSLSQDHLSNSVVTNLYAELLSEFLYQIKKQIIPGLENFNLATSERIFLKQSSDFYRTKGSEESFRILFSAIFGVPAKIIRPQENLIEPSKSYYNITTDLLVESISGDVEKCLNRTLYQVSDEGNLVYGTVTSVERITNLGREYYILSVDFNYDKDIINKGSLFGVFQYSNRTVILEDITLNPSSFDNAIYVNSTLGFPNQGTLRVDTADGLIYQVDYFDKNSNQFFVFTNQEFFIPKNSYLTSLNNAFCVLENETIQVRICPIFSNDYDLDGNSISLKEEDPIVISSLGENNLKDKFNDWIFNIKNIVNVSSISVEDIRLNKYKINFFDEINFYLKDKFELSSSDGRLYELELVSKNTSKSYTFTSSSSIINVNRDGFILKRKLSRSLFNSEFSPNFSSIANVQNVYTDQTNTDLFVETGSIPSYGDSSINILSNKISFDGNYSPEQENYILNTGRHNLITGDIVVYNELETVQEFIENNEGDLVLTNIDNPNRLSIKNGKYYVKVVDRDNIKLSASQSRLFNNEFINFSGNFTNNSLYYANRDWLSDVLFKDYIKSPSLAKISHQKLIRKISDPVSSGIKYETKPGTIGIFKNGTELLNYKSLDSIFYGSINEISVLSEGRDYDVINRPNLIIDDTSLGISYGSGAAGEVKISGSLKRIDILNKGVGFLNKPSITISGGNGFGALAEPVFESTQYSVDFNSSNSVSLATNEIIFNDTSYFITGEIVRYVSGVNSSLGGLTNGATYFVRQSSQNTIKLYGTIEDCNRDINEVNISSFSTGVHSIISVEDRKLIVDFKIISEGSGYKSTNLKFNSSQINIYDDSIKIDNHSLETGEVILYKSTDTPAEGLSSGEKYYVYKVNESKIKLSSSEDNLNRRIFVNIISSGTGSHTIEYDPITVTLTNLDNNNNNTLSIRPIFRGFIESVNLSANGSGYGTDEVINFNRQPSISLSVGSSCKLKPVVIQGRINAVIIENQGSGYTSIPDLTVFGDGSQAKLLPIINEGRIVDVIVQNPGIGYSKDTKISVDSAGSDANFFAQIQKWTVNIVEKTFSRNLITDDDGFLSRSKDSIKYTYCYTPRKLREYILTKRIESGIERFVPDLTINPVDNKELDSRYHSPIVGWAYDGNPIYGPYGFSNSNGTGDIKRLKSGYNITRKSNRPKDEITFPLGFFVEDYEYSDGNDLDAHNGRFCITPEYPNGVYAYFTTIGDIDRSYKNYRKPEFPYVIGNTYNSDPIDFNFDETIDQNRLDIYSNLVKNTSPYNIFKENSKYDGIDVVSLIQNHTSKVDKISDGSVDSISIISGGDNYKINDRFVFEGVDTNPNSLGLLASVDLLEGKKISNINQTSTNVENVEIFSSRNGIVALCTSPHGINDVGNYTYYFNESQFNSEFYPDKFSLVLASNLGDSSVTGIATYINVSGITNSQTLILENDIFTIDEEELKILEVDERASRLRVLRSQNGTVGLSHTAGAILEEKSRKLYSQSSDISRNRSNQIYFNPSESFGLGTDRSTLNIVNPAFYPSSISVDPGKIYLRNNILSTNDVIIYNSNSGFPIRVEKDSLQFSLQENQELYVYRYDTNFIGIYDEEIYLNEFGQFVDSSKNPIELFKFVDYGSGEYHSFKLRSNENDITLNQYNLEIQTETDHLLSTTDPIDFNFKYKDFKTLKVVYNGKNRRVCINPVSFQSSDIDLDKNTIFIQDHGFKDFDKVIYQSSSPSLNLFNDEIYYVKFIDNNKISLLDVNKNLVTIGSKSFGNILPINPNIAIENNKSIIFDLSDESLSFVKNNVRYSGFTLNIYTDEKYNNRLISTGFSNSLNVIKTGNIGIDLDAKVTLTYDEITPKVLYYKLEPIKNSVVPDFMVQAFVDDEFSNGRIDQLESGYSGRYNIIKVSDDSFKFSLNFIPSNFPSQYEARYNTNSLNTSGPINLIKFESKGKNFSKIPFIKNVSSQNGENFFGILSSSDIGNVKTIKIDNIKYELVSDPTLIPKGLCPISVKVEPLSSIEKIDILDFGKDYSQPPDLVLIDGFTNKPVTDLVLSINYSTFKVDILKNTKGIYNVTPKIIPINNTNGFKILSLNYDDFTKDATIVFDTVGFSTITAFPFEIGSKFIIENLVTLEPESDLGYNSENYDYKLYTVTDSDPNIGGQLPSITFNMRDFSGSENPGIIDSTFTSGRVIPEKFFPIFGVKLKKNVFFEDESVSSGEFKGKVLSWDKDNEFLKISTKFPQLLETGKIILGESSSSFGTISNIIGISTVNYKLSPLRPINKGWSDKKGFLNEESQRLHDSDYYQYFSYSVNSVLSNFLWDNLVQEVNHTAGFKRFSNLSIESDLEEYEISSEGSFLGVSNIDSQSNLNCIYDHDLVSENYIKINSDKNISDEIIFNSKLLQNYFESSGNRVLIVDDISGEFNSNSRSTRFSPVNQFPLSDFKYRKYFINSSNRFLPEDKQSIIVNIIQDGENGFLNQYARVETLQNQGYFDFTIFNNDAFLLFYPTEFEFEDYDITGISLNIGDELTGAGTSIWGNVAIIESTNTVIASGSTPGVPVKISTQSQDYRSSKYIITLETATSGVIQSNEFNVLNTGTDVIYTEFGSFESSTFDSDVSTGIATYYPELNGSEIDFYLVPNSNITEDYKVNIVNTQLSNDTLFDTGSISLKTSHIFSSYAEILSSPITSPGIVTTISGSYMSFYILASIEDTTNNIYEFKELVVVRNETDVYFTEFGNVISDDSLKSTGIGTFSGTIDGLTDQTNLLFEPLPNRDVKIRTFSYALELVDLLKTDDTIEFDESNITTIFGEYIGTENEVKREFELRYKGIPVFEREFDATDPSVVLLDESSIIIPNHFFNTGEQITYSHQSLSFAFPPDSIGIKTTIISGVSTDKLPTEVYAVKVSDTKIRLASTAENALKFNPEFLELTSVGIGSGHKFTATRPNVKSLITIDNIIQSPIQESEIKLELTDDVSSSAKSINLSGISSISSSDVLKINDEIVFVERVGVSSAESVRVRRRWLGTSLQAHSIGSTVTKLYGNYNIVNNKLNFIKAPFGKIPQSTPTIELGEPFIKPDDRDYVGITTSSNFCGRVFLRTGETNTSEEIYEDNYLFDNISRGFSGITSEFTLKTNNTDIVGISSNNALILLKDIFQQPYRDGASPITGNYKLIEDLGETRIQFNPSTQEVNDDINVTSLPVGGKIVSLGSTAGFGYQPLVSAGATAIISGFGTISQIIIGNSGSGYRSGIQTFVNVYSQTSSSIEIVGFASIVGGSINSVTITNPGTSYTNTNPPLITLDSPLAYYNLPLIYSNDSVQGIGTGARIDIVISRDSSVLDFEIRNNGYNYNEGEILTVDISEFVGIPTDLSKPFKEFQIIIDEVKNDEFSGWSIGDVQQLDPLDNLFNGIRKVFPLKFEGDSVSIIAKRGSNIDVESTLLIFINGILQVPGTSYTFKGGSRIIFSEPPKKGYSSNILFYRGTKDIDVKLIDVIEEVESGDTCTINSVISSLKQNERQIEQVVAADIISSTPYSGPGISDDETLLRPITVCRQTEDLYFNGSLIPKTRNFYEPIINPITNIIQNIDQNSTEIFVESLKTFFDSGAESISDKNRTTVQVLSQDISSVGIATAIVSSAGSITSIDIVNSGYGYTFVPQIYISTPPEYSLDRISAEISLSIVDEKISSISVVNPGRGYDSDNPPQITIEYPKSNIEDFISVDYEGDFGIIVGIANTIVGVGNTALEMDLYIENQSFLKNTIINPDISEYGISGISTNYFFVVSNSNIGLGVTSLYVNGTTLSTTNLYFDNIFQVYDFDINEKNVIGIGTTSVVTIKTLTTSLFDLTLPSFDNDLLTFDNTRFKFDSDSTQFSYFGNYSWGRMSFDPERSRKSKKEFNSYYQNGYSGISTSSIVRRIEKIKSKSQLNIV